MTWTEKELGSIGIMIRIDVQADMIATELILNKEGHMLSDYASQWINRDSKDFKHYFKTVRQNIIDNMHIEMNEMIRNDYSDHVSRLNGMNEVNVLDELLQVSC